MEVEVEAEVEVEVEVEAEVKAEVKLKLKLGLKLDGLTFENVARGCVGQKDDGFTSKFIIESKLTGGVSCYAMILKP